MGEKSGFEAISIGMDLDTLEMTLDGSTLSERVKLDQWEQGELIDKLHIAPPGMTIVQHAIIKYMRFPDLHASIWAKSEHEFLKPLRTGSKIRIHGKIVDKYVKRDRNYVVSEFETIDEHGDVAMRSRETAVHLE